jgi:hypothetical protein
VTELHIAARRWIPHPWKECKAYPCIHVSMTNLTIRAIMNTARIPALADPNKYLPNTCSYTLCYFIGRFFIQEVYHVDAPLRFALSHCPSCYDVLHGGFFHGEHDVAPEAFLIAGRVDSACGKGCWFCVFPCRTRQRLNIRWRY